MAIKTKCQTPNAIFKIKVKNKSVKCEVDLPFALNLSKNEAIQLEANIHNAFEMVLSKYFINKNN
jgi:hypothetical protein